MSRAEEAREGGDMWGTKSPQDSTYTLHKNLETNLGCSKENRQNKYIKSSLET